MNLGQALGELQLEITTLKERKGKREPVVTDSEAAGIIDGLKARLDEAEADAIKFGVQLSEAKRRAHIAEQKLAGTYERLAKYERRDAKTEAEQGDIVATVKAECEAKLSQAQEQAADYKRHIERMEAEARGYAMQIAELRRQRDEAAALASKQPAKVVEAPSECQTCAPIIRAIAKAVQASNEPAMPMPVNIEPVPAPVPCDKPSERLPQSKPMSIKQRILAALREADVPATAAQIGEHISLPAQTVQNNLYHLNKSREVRRLIPSATQGNWDMRGCRYWLTVRPIPAEAKA